MWSPNPDVLVTDLGDELVVLHAATGEMFSLNASGRAVWHSLPAPLERIEAALIAQGAPHADAQADAQALLAQMQAQGLVSSS